MNAEKKLQAEQDNAQWMISEMMEASIKLSIKKGEHHIKKGCNCIVCVKTRKEQLRGIGPKWKYSL